MRILSFCVRVLKKFRVRPRQRILGRVACLGKSLLALKYPSDDSMSLINQQKVRIDLWLDWFNGEVRPNAEVIKQYLVREDVYSLIQEQMVLPWNTNKEFNFFLIDSFAELTDQKFTHRENGWSFCCHRSDLDRSLDLDNIFECQGLLPIDKFESAYTNFFDWFENAFPGKQVIFVHFPTVLDSREVFKIRAAEIKRVMMNIESRRRYIKNIFIDDIDVEPAETDTFPYHYSASTNLAFIKKWNF